MIQDAQVNSGFVLVKSFLSWSSLIGSWGISWAKPEREFPQSFFSQVIAEVIEEGYDFIIRLQRVATAERGREKYSDIISGSEYKQEHAILQYY